MSLSPTDSGRRLHAVIRRFLLAAVVACGARGSIALAASVEVTPTTLTLSSTSPTELLTVRNLGLEDLRFEVNVSAWRQAPDGASVLTPNDDIIFFPQLMKVPAGASAKIRIGATDSPGAAEKAYRLLLQELPQLTTPGDNLKIQVLTAQSIPIFVAPPEPRTSVQIDAFALTPGTIAFTLSNTGTRHLLADTIRVIGADASGAQVFAQTANSWYLLARGSRDYKLPVSASECMRSHGFRVEVVADQQTFEQSFSSAPGRCR